MGNWNNLLVAVTQQWSLYCHAHERVAAIGLVVVKDGEPVMNAYAVVADRALHQLRKLRAECGLTPSSRSRITALSVGPTTSQWDNLLP